MGFIMFIVFLIAFLRNLLLPPLPFPSLHSPFFSPFFFLPPPVSPPVSPPSGANKQLLPLLLKKKIITCHHRNCMQIRFPRCCHISFKCHGLAIAALPPPNIDRDSPIPSLKNLSPPQHRLAIVSDFSGGRDRFSI